MANYSKFFDLAKAEGLEALELSVTKSSEFSFQLFRNFGPLYKADSLDTGELKDIKSSYVDLKNYQGAKITLAILF